MNPTTPAAVVGGRPKTIAVEASVAGLIVVIAAAEVTSSAWLQVAGFTGHGLSNSFESPRIPPVAPGSVRRA
jgi:hypothetical protein